MAASALHLSVSRRVTGMRFLLIFSGKDTLALRTAGSELGALPAPGAVAAAAGRCFPGALEEASRRGAGSAAVAPAGGPVWSCPLPTPPSLSAASGPGQAAAAYGASPGPLGARRCLLRGGLASPTAPPPVRPVSGRAGRQSGGRAPIGRRGGAGRGLRGAAALAAKVPRGDLEARGGLWPRVHTAWSATESPQGLKKREKDT